MRDDAVLRHQLRYRHAPFVGCRQQETLASFSACLLQIVTALANISAGMDDHAAIHAVRAFKLYRRRAAGIGFSVARYLQRPLRRLLFEVAIGRRIFGADLLPVTLKFFGDHHRVCREHAGSEFGLADTNGHSVVRRDRNPGIDFGNSRLAIPGLGRNRCARCRRAGRHPKTDDHRATNRGGGGQELAAIHVFFVLAHNGLLYWLRPTGLAFAPLMLNHATRLRDGWLAGCDDRFRTGKHWSSEHRCRRPRAASAFRAATPRPGSARIGSSRIAERRTPSRQAGPDANRQPTVLQWW